LLNIWKDFRDDIRKKIQTTTNISTSLKDSAEKPSRETYNRYEKGYESMKSSASNSNLKAY
jgi:hypothetical protein